MIYDVTLLCKEMSGLMFRGGVFVQTCQLSILLLPVMSALLPHGHVETSRGIGFHTHTHHK